MANFSWKSFFRKQILLVLPTLPLCWGLWQLLKALTLCTGSKLGRNTGLQVSEQAFCSLLCTWTFPRVTCAACAGFVCWLLPLLRTFLRGNESMAVLWGLPDAVVVRVLQCTLIWSSVSRLCNWERAELFCCVYGPGSQWLKSILVKLVSDWVQKKQEKMQGSLSHKASSVLTPRWKMVIPVLNASQVLFPKSSHPLASRNLSHNDSFPLP